jgi:hydrogenase maturation protein HypF
MAGVVKSLLWGMEDGLSTAVLAAIFHDELAEVLARQLVEAARQTSVRTIGLTGGVFANMRLLTRVCELLEGQGLNVLTHRMLSPGDGSIALGQAAVASARRSSCV